MLSTTIANRRNTSCYEFARSSARFDHSCSSLGHQAAAFRFRAFLSRSTRFESKDLASSSSVLRSAVSPFPARFMKYVSIRMPEPGPFGETFLEGNVLAIVVALLVNSPAGG